MCLDIFLFPVTGIDCASTDEQRTSLTSSSASKRWWWFIKDVSSLESGGDNDSNLAQH